MRLYHRIALRWWEGVWWLSKQALRPWLWYGPWESQRVIDWHLTRIVASAYYHEERAKS